MNNDIKKIKFKVVKDVYWDNWGRIVKSFPKGQICNGNIYPDGTVVAESIIYKGISDYVDLNCIEIIEELIN